MMVNQDVKKFYNYIENGLSRVGIDSKRYPLFSLKTYQTNRGLYLALTTYFNLIINRLDQYSFLALHGLYAPDDNDKQSTDQFANNVNLVKNSKKHFQELLQSKLLKGLISTTSDKGVIRTKLLDKLNQAKNFFMTYQDTKNPYYHQKSYYYSIIRVGKHQIYTNKIDAESFKSFSKDIHEYETELKSPQLLHKKAKQFKSFLEPTESVSQLRNNYANNIKEALKDAKDGLKRDKTIIANLLKQHHLSGHNYQVVVNPKANNDTNSARVVTIAGIKFYYSPNDVSLKRIIDMNIPYLPCDQDEYWVGHLGSKAKNNYGVVEY